MGVLIKNKQVTENLWNNIESTEALAETAPSFSILPLSAFSSIQEWPIKHKRLGAHFKADIELSDLSQEILSLPLLCIDISDFNHGQVFSLAIMIKQNFNYQGELRVTGDLLLDQIPYLSQCGVDAFSLKDLNDSEYAVLVLKQAPSPSRFHRPFS